MFTIPFLTDLDPHAAVKGSRDPLGIQTIWARLGRHVVGNLTTVSTSVRDFTTLILGYYFAERVALERNRQDDLGVFLRWEQLAAYARGEINGDWAFRGVERVKKNLNEGVHLHLGTDSDSQILSNQKTYGLWGLYTVSARSSGLVEGEPTRLTGVSRHLVEQLYLPIFARYGFRNADAVVARLAKPKSDLDPQKTDRQLLKTIAKVLQNPLVSAEKDVYRRHLLHGGPQDKTDGSQEILATAIDSTLDDANWMLSPARVRHLAKRCRAQSGGLAAANSLERIRTAELLLAPAAAMFGFILASDGQTPAELSVVIKRKWGEALHTIDVNATAALEVEFRDSQGDAETGRRWLRISQALSSGDFEDTLRLLIAQNGYVMRTRAGAAPWVEVTHGKLHVRFRDDNNAILPSRSHLPDFWRHSYFLDSLRFIALTLRT